MQLSREKYKSIFYKAFSFASPTPLLSSFSAPGVTETTPHPLSILEYLFIQLSHTIHIVVFFFHAQWNNNFFEVILWCSLCKKASRINLVFIPALDISYCMLDFFQSISVPHVVQTQNSNVEVFNRVRESLRSPR